MLDGDFIGKERAKVMTSELFEEPMISDKLGGKEACTTLVIPTDKACSHIRPLYIMTKFDGQLVSRTLVDDKTTLNVLPAFMLRKVRRSLICY